MAGDEVIDAVRYHNSMYESYGTLFLLSRDGTVKILIIDEDRGRVMSDIIDLDVLEAIVERFRKRLSES